MTVTFLKQLERYVKIEHISREKQGQSCPEERN